jgi:hypothetical protein
VLAYTTPKQRVQFDTSEAVEHDSDYWRRANRILLNLPWRSSQPVDGCSEVATQTGSSRRLGAAIGQGHSG